MVNRGRMRRAIIFCPAGLTWNWRRELHHFFDLEFRVLRSADFDERDPFSEPGGQFVIVSVDTAATPSMRSFLAAKAVRVSISPSLMRLTSFPGRTRAGLTPKQTAINSRKLSERKPQICCF